MPLNEDESVTGLPDDNDVAVTPPYIVTPPNNSRVGPGNLYVHGGGNASHRVRIASVGLEDALSAEVLMDGNGVYDLRFYNPIIIGLTQFQVILWPPYPALRSQIWTVYHLPAPIITFPPSMLRLTW